MQLDQNTQQDREKCVLETVKTIERSLQILKENPEAPQDAFKAVLNEMDIARHTAAAYLKKVSEFTGDNTELDDRVLQLSNLSYITKHFDKAREEMAHGLEGKSLSAFFRAGVKRCDAEMAEAIILINETVRKGHYIVKFQQACLGSAGEAPAKKPQAARPGWMKLVVDNTPVCS